MSPGYAARFSILICSLMLVFQSSQCSPSFWRPTLPPTLPSNPRAPIFKKFETVPPAKQTANKLMTKFLGLRGHIGKRQFGAEDIVVVMDGSGSVGRCEFDKGKTALSNMMGLASANVGVSTKYAAVTFASSAKVEFKFEPYTTASNKIKGIQYPSGMTNTQAGLTEAKKLFDDPSLGNRRYYAKKMVFLVTDGQSNRYRHLTVPKAQALQKAGVKIFVVAVGSYIHGIDEMVRVASHPREDHIFRVNNLDGFLEIIKLVIQKVSPSKYAIIKGQYTTPCYSNRG